MTLKETIAEDMKSFMKQKDSLALEVIRCLRSDVKNVEIDKKEDMDDAGVIRVVQSSIKKHKEAGDIFREAGRDDLVTREDRYVEILSKYMPAQMDEAGIKRAVEDVLAGMGDVDPQKGFTETSSGKHPYGFGTVMKAVMAKVGSSADGKVVGKVVKEVLDGRN